MQLKQIIDTIKYGELNTVSWEEDRVPQVISYINLALTNLYSNFPILEKQVIVQQYPQISIYNLTSEYARTNTESKQYTKYILDTPFEPFTDDILLVTGLCDEYGRPIPLNDDTDPRSYFLPAFNQLQIPNANEEETTFVIYRAAPKYIEPETDDFTQDVFLPRPLLEPLCCYVAYRTMIAIGSQEELARAQILEKRYNDLCLEVATNNLLGNNLMPTNIKPIIGGYE